MLRGLFLLANRAAASSCTACCTQWRARNRPPRGARSYWVDSKGYEHFESSRSPYAAYLPYAAAAAGVGSVGYYWSRREQVPYTGRMHAILWVSQSMEQQIGEQTFQQVKQEASEEGTLLPPNHPAVQLVRKIGTRIAEVAATGDGKGYIDHMKQQRWEYAVIDSPQVNAFVAPGGKVVVYTGLMSLMSSEDELAAVLAHETGHVLARHVAERLSQFQVAGVLNLLSTLLLGVRLPGSLVLLSVFLPYSRQAEHEADAIGIRLLAKACYDPRANLSMLYKLEQQEKQSGPRVPTAILSTHPLTSDRLDKVEALLPEAMTMRQEYCQHLHGYWQDALLHALAH